MKTQIIEIRTGSIGLKKKISVIQEDTARQLRCILSDFIIPDGSTARIYAVKPSGNKIYNDGVIEGNTVLVDITTQLIAEIGEVACQVEITESNGNVLTSFEFAIEVKKRLKDASAIESTNEFTALEAALGKVQNIDTKVSKNTNDISELKTTDNVLSSRIDMLSSLKEGSTTADAELLDIRVKADGSLATSAGNAVREQFDELKGDIDDINNGIENFGYQYLPSYLKAYQNKYWSSANNLSNADGFYAFKPFTVKAGTYYYCNIAGSFSYVVNSEGTIKPFRSEPDIIYEIKFEEEVTLYITSSDNVGKEYAMFSNYFDITQKIYGLRGVYLENIIGANGRFIPTQYLDKDLIYDDKYWSGVEILSDASNYVAFKKVKLKKGKYYYRNISHNFSFFYGSTSKETIKPFYEYKNEVTFEEDGFAYITVGKEYYNYEDSIICDIKYPKSLEQVSGKLFNFIPKYKLVNNYNNDYLIDNKYYNTYGSTLNGNTCTINIDDNGLDTDIFSTISSNVKVNYDLTYSGESNIRIYIKINKNDGSVKYVKKLEDNRTDIKGYFYFDASSYAVYDDAKDYQILIWGSAGTSFVVNDISIQELTSLESSEYYKDNLEDMLSSLIGGIENIEGKMISNSNVLRNPNGDKYGLQVNSNGELVAYSYVPTKYIVMGNSITCGMDNLEQHGGRFGMASTSFNKDWVYHVDSAIKANNSSATYTRIYSSPFEHCETLSDAITWVNQNKSQFASDTDLVIIEMGDNVNTDVKRTVFADSFQLLLSEIRTISPKARVVVVGIWFNNSITKNIMINACEKYGCSFVNISDLNIKENQATVGDTVTYRDGTTGTISESISTHPGDNGMRKIADRIIETLDM